MREVSGATVHSYGWHGVLPENLEPVTMLDGTSLTVTEQFFREQTGGGQGRHIVQFKVGDVVILNSGGPRMTVTRIPDTKTTGIGNNYITVEWWNGLAMGSSSFPPECLTYLSK